MSIYNYIQYGKSDGQKKPDTDTYILSDSFTQSSQREKLICDVRSFDRVTPGGGSG